MSTITSVALVTNREMAPFVPAGTMAALETTSPVGEFSVETFGIAEPVGQAVR
jgi:hypothetical protein